MNFHYCILSFCLVFFVSPFYFCFWQTTPSVSRSDTFSSSRILFVHFKLIVWHIALHWLSSFWYFLYYYYNYYHMMMKFFFINLRNWLDNVIQKKKNLEEYSFSAPMFVFLFLFFFFCFFFQDFVGSKEMELIRGKGFV